MLRHRLDVGSSAAAIAKCPAHRVDDLADVSVFDEDAGPHRLQHLVPRNQGAGVSDQMDKGPERLVGDDHAFAA